MMDVQYICRILASQQHHNLLSGSDGMQVQQVYFSVLACYDLMISTKH